MAGGSINTIKRGFSVAIALLLLLSATNVRLDAAEPKKLLGLPSMSNSTTQQRKQVLNSLPMNRLTPQARARINSIAKKPTIYRRLPTQAINCDRDMFLFMTRKPEALVAIWDLMEITQVKTRRTGPYQLEADDGAGTKCVVDLIYGDNNLHILSLIHI